MYDHLGRELVKAKQFGYLRFKEAYSLRVAPVELVDAVSTTSIETEEHPAELPGNETAEQE